MGSPAKPTVFLSYASEDSAAAQRICESLRAAGIEVWFDQSELRGGEAWDRQIRRQIHDCGLFLAVISSHTEARTEGYFRREWRLAVERTHDMADDAPFLVPIVIDRTNEASARVPDSFRDVQWMRLPDGEISGFFVERIGRLLSCGAPADSSPAIISPVAAARPGGIDAGRSSKMGTRVAMAAMAVAVLIAGYFIAERQRSSPRAPAALQSAPSAHDASAATNMPAKSVAVLPFVNMSSDKEQEYFSDGLSEELINLLAKIPDLRVSARTSSFYFKGKPTLIADIAKALGVANVLEGSVRKSGKTIRVSAQLVRADNGATIWSETYDRPFIDIFRIQDEIAESVVNGLKISLLAAPLHRATPTSNTKAYTLYLQAASINRFAVNSADFARAREYLHSALQLDPAFAPAWAALAANLAVASSLFGTVTLQQAHSEGHAAVKRALDLDPQLPAAYVALCRLLFEVDWNWDAAEIELLKGIQLEPGNAEAYRLAAYIAITRGQFNEARKSIGTALSLDPLESWNHVVAGYIAYRTGELANAEGFYRKAIALNPSSAKFHYVLGSLLLIQGQPTMALAEMQRETDERFRLCGIVLALDALGRKVEADRSLALAERDLANVKPYLIALIYAARHDRDRAFDWLERALKKRDGDLLYINGDPMLADLTTDPRYRQFKQKMQSAH